MVEARGELRLDEEPLAEALVRRELRRQQFDCHLAPQVDVLAERYQRSSAADGETLGPEPDMFRLCRMVR